MTIQDAEASLEAELLERLGPVGDEGPAIGEAKSMHDHSAAMQPDYVTIDGQTLIVTVSYDRIGLLPRLETWGGFPVRVRTLPRLRSFR